MTDYRLAVVSCGRHCIVAIGLALSLVGMAAAEKPATPEPSWSDKVVELPKFIVTDSRELPQPETWRYTQIPGFEIISSASDRETQRLMRDFALFQQALSVVWRMPSRINTPVLLVLCGKAGQFERFSPPRSTGSQETARASLFLKGRERDAIIVDLASLVLFIQSPDAPGADPGVDSTEFTVEHNKQLYREYVRYVLSKSEPRLPAWFEEGLSQIVMAMKFDRKFIEFGKLEDPNAVSIEAAIGMETGEGLPGAPAEDRDFNKALARRALVPLDQFFVVTHNAPEAQNPLGNNRWAKQAYAFVHMGLFGEERRWQKPFSEFALRSTQQPVTEAMFKECFKMSYKEMSMQLRGYILNARYQSQEFLIKKGELPGSDALTLRDATDSEAGRIKGQALLIAGHVDAARNEFIAPYVRGERDPQLLAALGLSEHSAGKIDRARKFLTAAVAAKTADPEAYVTLARMRLADAAAAPAGANGHFSSEQTSGIVSLLTIARSLPPSSVLNYELLAETLAQSAARPTPADVAPLTEGVQRYPRHLKLAYATAVLCADAGQKKIAHALVEHGLKFAPEGIVKTRFQQLRDSLPPVSDAPSTSTGK